MPSPPGSRASSVLGGGDAGEEVIPPAPHVRIECHPDLNGRPCDRNGNFLPPNTPPTPQERPPIDDFGPYASRADFELADLLYRRVQMSAGTIDELMQNWAARPESAGDPPFADHEDLYNTIDATEIGHVPWESFAVKYNQPIAPGGATDLNSTAENHYGPATSSDPSSLSKCSNTAGFKRRSNVKSCDYYPTMFSIAGGIFIILRL
ncbi:hypothetical protein B0H10DRAFT_1959968 [Mycena sp. CBHHK59/15]|nr:hypothetical protein B0H10DRAFT_1959968 [Mycena sp. CBHHK59/15]